MSLKIHNTKRKVLRNKLFTKQKERCAICDGMMTNRNLIKAGINPLTHIDPYRGTFEHIIPRRDGGSDKKEGNLCMVHLKCNQWRGIHPFEAFRAKYGKAMFEWCNKGFKPKDQPKLPNPNAPLDWSQEWV